MIIIRRTHVNYYFVLDPKKRTETTRGELSEGAVYVEDAAYENVLYVELGCISYVGWNNGDKVALVKIDETVGEYLEAKAVGDDNICIALASLIHDDQNIPTTPGIFQKYFIKLKRMLSF